MTEPHYKGATPNHHGIGLMVKSFNEAVSTDQTLTKTGALVGEEARELLEACQGDDLAQIVKEACDVIWTATDVLVAHGIDVYAAFTEIFRSNMTKIGPNGEIERRPDGKILKGPHFQPVDPDRLLGIRRPLRGVS